MLKRIFAILTVFLLAGSLIFACGPDDPDNQDDEAECTEETQDDDCEEGQVCSEDGVCVEEEEPTSCTEETQDEDCGEGEICDPDTTVCIDDPDAGGCTVETQDEDCTGEDQICDPDTNVCIDDPTVCTLATEAQDCGDLLCDEDANGVGECLEVQCTDADKHCEGEEICNESNECEAPQ